MKKRFPWSLMLLIGIYLVPTLSYGQDQEKNETKKREKYYGFEIGHDFFSANVLPQDFIRGDINPSAESESLDFGLDNVMSKWHIAATLDLRSKNQHLAFITGIKYSQFLSSMSATDESNFYYMIYNQTPTTSELARVKKIDQTASYIGVPLGIRFFPLSPRTVQVYLKAGVDFNFLIENNMIVDFLNSNMADTQKSVADQFDSPSDYFSIIHAGIGLKVGKPYETNFTFEFTPTVITDGNPSSISKSDIGASIKFNFQLPF